MNINGQLHASTVFPPGNQSQYQFDRRLDRFLRQFGRYEDEKNILLLLGIELQFLGTSISS
jgi:hypothetical protein